MTPNLDELRHLGCICSAHIVDLNDGRDDRVSLDILALDHKSMEDMSIQELACFSLPILSLMGSDNKISHVIVSRGKEGVVWFSLRNSVLNSQVFAPAPVDNPDLIPLVTNGAGDAFSGGLVAGLCQYNYFRKCDWEDIQFIFPKAINCGLLTACNRILRNSGLN